MNLRLHLLSDLRYDTKMQYFPIVLEVSTESKITIASKVDLLIVSLQHMSQSNIEYGHFSTGILGRLRDKLTVSPQLPYFKLVNALEKDDDSLVSGKYQLQITVRIFVWNNREFTSYDLTASKQITIQ